MSKSSRTKRRDAQSGEKTIPEGEGAIVISSAGAAQVQELQADAALRGRRTSLIILLLFLSLLILGTYARVYNPQFGWTKMDGFGAQFEQTGLPRLQRTRHFVEPGSGYDGQFYAQLAIDPSVRDPAFDRTLDEPVYRARRIGMSALAFCLGGGKPRRIIQAYALTNLIFWFVLLGAVIVLSRPWTIRQQLCIASGLMSFGSVASMEHAFVDLPATAIIFVGIALGGWGGYVAFAAAVLTRETSVLAALGNLDLRRPFTLAVWRRNLTLLAVVSVPLALWIVYLHQRFTGLQTNTGYGNFGIPLQVLGERFLSSAGYCLQAGLSTDAKAGGPFGWLYLDEGMHEVLAIVALFCQGLYLALRWNPSSAVWRTGLCFAVLGGVLGPAVWEWTGAAARVLLPMTLCFYLLVAKERDAWFWPFFVLGSLSVPYAVHEFYTVSW